MKIEDKWVAFRAPKDLHMFLKAKAKKAGVTLGNYVFECICKEHNVEYIPATVKIPEQETVVPQQKLGDEEPEDVPEEVRKDIEEMEKTEAEEQSVGEPEIAQDVNQIF